MTCLEQQIQRGGTVQCGPQQLSSKLLFARLCPGFCLCWANKDFREARYVGKRVHSFALQRKMKHKRPCDEELEHPGVL